MLDKAPSRLCGLALPLMGMDASPSARPSSDAELVPRASKLLSPVIMVTPGLRTTVLLTGRQARVLLSPISYSDNSD
jgi:hypothetical protein